jgi:hypothetical protein
MLGAALADRYEQIVPDSGDLCCRALLIDRLLVGRLSTRTQKRGVLIEDDFVRIPLSPVTRPKHLYAFGVVQREPPLPFMLCAYKASSSA